MNLTCPLNEEVLSFSLVLAPPAAGTLTDMLFTRQTHPLIIDHGRLNPNLSNRPK